MSEPAPQRGVGRRAVLTAAGTGLVGFTLGTALGRLLPEEEQQQVGAPFTGATVEASNATASDSSRPGLGRRQVIWSVPTDAPLIALTFDDGPDPEFTPRILAALERTGALATFNVMGYNALRHPALLRAAVAAGHEIGNHTWTHQDLAHQTAAGTWEQLSRGKDDIEQVVRVPLRFFRPPRGELTGSAVRFAARLDYDILLWSVTRGPGNSRDPRVVADHVSTTVRPGDVVGLHDGIGRGTFFPGSPTARGLRARREVEVRALPTILTRLRAAGLQSVTVSALLRAAR